MLSNLGHIAHSVIAEGVKKEGPSDGTFQKETINLKREDGGEITGLVGIEDQEVTVNENW